MDETVNSSDTFTLPAILFLANQPNIEIFIFRKYLYFQQSIKNNVWLFQDVISTDDLYTKLSIRPHIIGYF